MDPKASAEQITRFIEAQFDIGDTIEIRYLRFDTGAAFANFLPVSRLAAAIPSILASNSAPRRFNVYVGGNPRIGNVGTADGVKLCRSLFVEWDDLTIDEAMLRMQQAGLPSPTTVIHSGRGPHAWLRLAEPTTDLEAWLATMRHIAFAVGSDPTITDLPRIMRLPGTRNWKHADAWATLVDCCPTRRYALADLRPSSPAPTAAQFAARMAEARAAAKPAPTVAATAAAAPPPQLVADGQAIDEIEIGGSLADAAGEAEGGRNARLAQLVGGAFASGLDEQEIRDQARAFASRCRPPLPQREADAVVASIGKTHRRQLEAEDAALDAIEPKRRPWPDYPATAMRHGILDELVQAVVPHTEADPVAIAAAFTVAFGSIVGRGPHCMISGTRHGVNEFLAIVGSSARARKGTATEIALLLLAEADPVWRLERVQRGLVSGEGLIDRVADAETDIDEKPVRGDDEAFDCVVRRSDGTADKRLLIDERELASVFKAGQRRENTLSQTLRSAWDGGTLGTLAKNSYRIATETHISMIGNVTGGELATVRNTADLAGGLYNRILWAVARRTKLLPDGGPGLADAIRPVADRAAELVAFAQAVGRMDFTHAATVRWREVYAHLATVTAPGLAGMCLERSETHGRRVAMLMALLRRQEVVDAPDIDAAVDLLRYSEQSVRYLFGSTSERPLDSKLIEILEQRGASSRSDLYRALGSRVPGEQLAEAIDRLLEAGAIAQQEVSTAGRRRVEFAIATTGSSAGPLPTSYILHHEQDSPPPAASAVGMRSLEEWAAIQPAPRPPETPVMHDARSNKPQATPPADADELPPANAFRSQPAEAEPLPEQLAELADGQAVDEIVIARPQGRRKAVGKSTARRQARGTLAFPAAPGEGVPPSDDIPF